MNILAIETSCDETALSLIKTSDHDDVAPNFTVLSDLVISQIDIHKEYGGVFPALAKREHAKNLVPLFVQALKEANLYHEHSESRPDLETMQKVKEILAREPELFVELDELFDKISLPHIDLIMVTEGPGLAPALWVGVNFARALAVLLDVEIVPVNHMKGHITSILLKENYRQSDAALLPLDDFAMPLLALLISGGHTQLVLVQNWGEYEIIGESIDDAVGEVFDKVARMLGMEYPGGPKISRAAQSGQPNDQIKFPRPMMHSGDYRFSFSGLKTAVRYLVQDLTDANELDTQTINDIAREFQEAVADVLVKKTIAAIEEYDARGLIIAGGVSANRYIRSSFTKALEPYDIPLYVPNMNLCGDNSMMIASAGYLDYWKHKKKATKNHNDLVAVANLRI